MESPTSPILRPLRLGELLDQAIRIYRRNFLTFVGIIALVYIPTSVIQAISAAAYSASTIELQRDPERIFSSPIYLLSLAGMILTGLVSFIFVSGLGTAATTNAISRSYFGQKISILSSYQQLGSTWLKLIAALFLLFLLTMGIFIWLLVPIVGWFTGPGILVFMGTVVAQILPAIIVIENLDATAAVSRAWDLARRRFWWLLTFAVIFYLFDMLLVSGPTFLVTALVTMLLGQNGSLQTANGLSTLIGTVGGNLINLFVLPIQLIAWTLIYFDIRVRTEGFDLALSTLAPSEDGVVDISSIPAAAPTQKWLTGTDVGRFAIISLVVVGLYAIFIAIFFFSILGIGSLLPGR